jgi:hypothetical protein
VEEPPSDAIVWEQQACTKVLQRRLNAAKFFRDLSDRSPRSAFAAKGHELLPAGLQGAGRG